jgi:hypothetical protein
MQLTTRLDRMHGNCPLRVAPSGSEGGCPVGPRPRSAKGDVGERAPAFQPQNETVHLRLRESFIGAAAGGTRLVGTGCSASASACSGSQAISANVRANPVCSSRLSCTDEKIIWAVVIGGGPSAPDWPLGRGAIRRSRVDLEAGEPEWAHGVCSSPNAKVPMLAKGCGGVNNAVASSCELQPRTCPSPSSLASSWPTPWLSPSCWPPSRATCSTRPGVRWIARFALEVPGLPADSVQLALSALLLTERSFSIRVSTGRHREKRTSCSSGRPRPERSRGRTLRAAAASYAPKNPRAENSLTICASWTPASPVSQTPLALTDSFG